MFIRRIDGVLLCCVLVVDSKSAWQRWKMENGNQRKTKQSTGTEGTTNRQARRVLFVRWCFGKRRPIGEKERKKVSCCLDRLYGEENEEQLRYY